MTFTATSTKSTIIPSLRYRDARAAIDWLCNVLGFARHHVYEDPDGSIAHAELTLCGGMIMLGLKKDDEYGRNFASPEALGGKETRSAYIVVPDSDALYARALSAQAVVLRPIADMSYGSREFTLKDPEGHSWTVGTYDPWQS